MNAREQRIRCPRKVETPRPSMTLHADKNSKDFTQTSKMDAHDIERTLLRQTEEGQKHRLEFQVSRINWII